MKGDWSKVVDIIKHAEKVVFTQEGLKKAVGSTQKGPISLKHSQVDLTDWAAKAGHTVRKTVEGLIEFTKAKKS